MYELQHGYMLISFRLCVPQAALNLGAEVTSISRSGRPKSLSASWADRVKWVQGDIFDASKSWKDELRGVSGIVSTLGAFGSNEFMYQICGSANMELMDVARDVGVPRFAFISVHDYKFLGAWSREPLLLKGYFKGKRDAERHLFETFPETGIALRPTFVYGKRQLPNGVSIPLELLGAPMAAVLKLLPTKRISSVPILGAALAPPVSVDAVGRAAASSILCPHLVSPGIMDVWTISKF